MHVLNVFSVFLANRDIVRDDVLLHPQHCTELSIDLIEERLLQDLLHLKVRLLGRFFVLVSLNLS